AWDVLDLHEVTGLDSLALLNPSDTPDGARFEFSGSSIVLQGVQTGALTARNFSFHQKVGDGYVSGATVFADANGNGLLDAGEASTTSDATGTFDLAQQAGTLIAFGGVDTSTGVSLRAQLSAPAYSIVISPLTTLLTAGANQGKLLAALGLPAGFDITIF